MSILSDGISNNHWMSQKSKGHAQICFPGDRFGCCGEGPRVGRTDKLVSLSHLNRVSGIFQG